MEKRLCYLGTDPEFFFTDRQDNVVPAEKVLPFTDQALEIACHRKGASSLEGKAVTLHADGFQGEITAAESFCRHFGLDRVRAGLKAAKQVADKNDLLIKNDPARRLTQKILMSASDKGRAFGCDIDYISWLDGAPNIGNVDPQTHLVRYSGGHIHVGFIETGDYNIRTYYMSALRDDPSSVRFLEKGKDLLTSPEGKIRLVKVLDMVLGNTMVLIDQNELSTLRRETYGKAGVYRETPYGIEYRVLSNFFLKHPALLHLVWGLTREAYCLMVQDRDQELFNRLNPRDIIVAINKNDRELAFKNWMVVREVLGSNDVQMAPHIEFVSKYGLDSIVDDRFDQHWDLNPPADSFVRCETDRSNTMFSGYGLGCSFPKLVEKHKKFGEFSRDFSTKQIYI